MLEQDDWEHRLETVNHEIKELEERLAVLRNARRNIVRRVNDGPVYFVKTTDVKPIIERLLRQYGTINSLCVDLNVSSSTIKDIINESKPYVKLTTVDYILTAADLNYEVNHLTLYLR